MRRFAHKTLLLSTVIFLILLSLPFAALADGVDDEHEFTQTAGGYEVTLVFENPAAIGENQIHVRVSDAHHAPVSNADVEVSLVEGEAEHTEAEPIAQPEEAGMHGMSEAPVEVSEETHDEMDMIALEAGHESGEYAGEIAIDSAGDWIIRVHLTVQGELVEVDFPLSVASSQKGAGILTGFFALNAAIIVSAVYMKRKPVSIQKMNEA